MGSEGTGQSWCKEQLVHMHGGADKPGVPELRVFTAEGVNAHRQSNRSWGREAWYKHHHSLDRGLWGVESDRNPDPRMPCSALLPESQRDVDSDRGYKEITLSGVTYH